MIYLHTLGDALIRIGEKDIRPTAPLLFAALLYLGMERGRRVPRTALQELLFPHADERSASHSLRQLLYKLRQLGAPLDADASSVTLQVSSVHDDAHDLSLANGQAKNAEKYALGLLPDYEPQLSDRLDEWLEHRRASVAADIRRELVAAMVLSREAINWPAVERYAQLILAVDPFNEEATLALAEATALSGAKAEALTILTRYESETGRRDLRLPASLLRRRISEQIPDVKRRVFHTPFVGREADAEAIRHEILQARRGVPSLVVVAGEPGIGKTRLLEETVALAALEGFHVQRVSCQPHHSARPLGVFIELVPALLTCRGALGVSPQSLANLNLLISHADDRSDRPTDVRDDVTRSGVLLRAVRDLVDSVATETPLLLAIEDVHWADADSLRELSSLAESLSSRSLLVIYTTRFLDALRRTGAINDSTIIRRLKPLATESMADLARHLLLRANAHHEIADIVSWCIKTASGNPLFLKMICAHYEETGQPFSVPPDLISATSRRIEQLPQECRRILEFCALLGRHSTLAGLRSLAECSDMQLLNAAQRLEEEGFLFLEGNAARISHDLLSECTFNLVPPFTRTILHSVVAASLERRYDATHDAALLWDCAEQWSMSGEDEKALQFLRRCASHASQIGHAARALAILSRAKDIAKYPRDRAAVLGEMMLAAKAAGQWSDVYQLSKQLALVKRDIAETPPHTHEELLAIEAQFAMRMEAGVSVARLLCCLEAPDASIKHRVDAAVLLLRMAHEFGEHDLAARAYSLVEPLLDPRSTSYSNRILPVIYHVSFGDPDRAIPVAQKLAAELDSIEPMGDQCRAATNLSMALSYLGLTEAALGIAGAYYDKTGALGMEAWQADFAVQSCVQCLAVEDFETAVPLYERVEQFAPRVADSMFARKFMSAGFEIALSKGDATLARRILDDLGKATTGKSVRGKSYHRGAEIRLLQLDPRFNCDDETLAELCTLHATTKGLGSADGMTVALCEALRRRGMRDEVRRVLEDYIQSSRRERSAIPPSLGRLVGFCSEQQGV
jgi:DNA-binding SARP family transcriptional activator